MFKRIKDLEPGDLFIMAYFSDFKMGRVLYNTEDSVKVEVTKFTNCDVRKEGIKTEIRYFNPYRYVLKIN